MSEFPAQCVVGGHPARRLNDETELITHYTSEHPGMALADYRLALEFADLPPEPSDPDQKLLPVTSQYARFGLLPKKLHKIAPEETYSGGDLSAKQLTELLEHIGSTRDITIDPHHFFLDLFIFILRYGATEDASGLGYFTLRDTNSPATVDIHTNVFLSEGEEYFTPKNILFTYRRFVYALDGLFWELWNDPKLTALDQIKRQGTARSRNWKLDNGRAPPAYVLVPGLFDTHLTPSEWECRKRYREAAQLEKDRTEGTDYKGQSGKRDVENDQVRDSSLRTRMKLDKLWRSSGGAANTPSYANYPPPPAPRDGHPGLGL